MKWYAEQIMKLGEQLATVESSLHRKCREIPYAENILAINGVGETYCLEYWQKWVMSAGLMM